MADLSDFVEIMDTLSTTLYETKQNVNIILEDQLSTHVTAEDLNNIKNAIAQLAANINLINKYLINLANANSGSGNSSSNILDIYKENNNYIRQQQLVVDGNYVNDSVVYLDQYYVRVKNIFVDGFKMSYSSPYNLVSWSEFNNTIRNYLRNTNNYEGGRFITINSETDDDNIINRVNCTIQGEGVINIANDGSIKIRPGGNGQVLKTVNGIVSWSIDKENVYTKGTGITINNNVISIDTTNADNVNNTLHYSTTNGIYWGPDNAGVETDNDHTYGPKDTSLDFNNDTANNYTKVVNVNAEWLSSQISSFFTTKTHNSTNNTLKIDANNNIFWGEDDNTGSPTDDWYKYKAGDTSLTFNPTDSTNKGTTTIKINTEWLNNYLDNYNFDDKWYKYKAANTSLIFSPADSTNNGTTTIKINTEWLDNYLDNYDFNDQNTTYDADEEFIHLNDTTFELLNKPEGGDLKVLAHSGSVFFWLPVLECGDTTEEPEEP